jgi:hypothetical protein
MKKYLAGVVVLFAFIMACGDNDQALVTDVTFNFQFVTADGPIQLDEPFELNGSTVQFETANYYFHGFQMGGNGIGLFYDDTDAHVLARMDLTKTFSDINVAPVDLTAVEITIGVEETINGQGETDFTDRTSDDPLAIQDPSMHWNWNSGYKFVRFDGEVDTDDDGIVDTPIAYHLGSDALRTDLQIAHDNIPLSAKGNRLTMVFDLEQFFSGVDFQLESNWDTHTGNNLPLAEQLRDNLSSTFTITQ